MSDHEEDESFARERLVEAIENQLASGEPSAAGAVFNKLSLLGYPREERLELMALVLAHEIHAMLREGRPFDLAAYTAALRALPDLPEEPSA